MGQFSLNGVFTTTPDPQAFEHDGFEEIGTYVDGAPLLQGKENGTLVWGALTHAEFIQLYARWNTNKGTAVAGAIPQVAAGVLATYDAITAFFHEPQARVEGKLWKNVRMRVTYITR